MRARLGTLWASVFIIIAIACPLLAGEAQDAFNDGVKFYRAGKFKESIAAYDRAIKAAPRPLKHRQGFPPTPSSPGRRAIKDYDRHPANPARMPNISAAMP
jgi:hypothetical protein